MWVYLCVRVQSVARECERHLTPDNTKKDIRSDWVYCARPRAGGEWVVGVRKPQALIRKLKAKPKAPAGAPPAVPPPQEAR